MLERHGVGAGLLAGSGQALQQAQDDEQDGREDPDLGVGGQQADGDRRRTHEQQGEDEHRLAADAVAEVPEHDRTDGARRVRHAEGGEGGEAGRARVGRREEQVGEDQSGRVP